MFYSDCNPKYLNQHFLLSLINIFRSFFGANTILSRTEEITLIF